MGTEEGVSAREAEARQLFMERLDLTGGRLVVAEVIPLSIGKPMVYDFDVRLRDGEVYKLRNVPGVVWKPATREEHLAAVRAYWDRQLAVYGEACPDEYEYESLEFPYYYWLSFD